MISEEIDFDSLEKLKNEILIEIEHKKFTTLKSLKFCSDKIIPKIYDITYKNRYYVYIVKNTYVKLLCKIIKERKNFYYILTM